MNEHWIQPPLFNIPAERALHVMIPVQHHVSFEFWLGRLVEDEGTQNNISLIASIPMSSLRGMYNEQVYQDEIKWKGWCSNASEKSKKG